MKKALFGTTQKRHFCRGPSAFSPASVSLPSLSVPHTRSPPPAPQHAQARGQAEGRAQELAGDGV